VLEAQQLQAMAASRVKPQGLVPERRAREVAHTLGNGLRAQVLWGGLV